MRNHNGFRWKLASAALLSTLALGVGATGAFASEPDAPELYADGLARDITDKSELAAIEQLPSAVSLSGAESASISPFAVHPNCYGRTDDPHPSGGDASVHGSTGCTGGIIASDLQVTTNLYRVDWWGLNWMNSDTDTRTSGYQVEATPHSSCDGAPNREYAGLSSHHLFQGGENWYGNTSNYASFACNW